MTDTTDHALLRAALGELSDDALRVHQTRLAQDEGYRAAHARLTELRGMLATLPSPALAPGLEGRVMARLRAHSRQEVMITAMTRQFWRLALPAFAGAAILFGFALDSGSRTVVNEPVTLATWYPISVDPTTNP